MTFYYSAHISFPLALQSRFLCVIFPPDGAVPLSVRVERERLGGWKGGKTKSDRQERGDRRGREKKKERQRQKAWGKGRRKETGEKEGEVEEGAYTHMRALRHGIGQEGVKVKTITRGAGSVRLCAAPWKCQALCSLTVSCTRRPESAGSLTKTDSSN